MLKVRQRVVSRMLFSLKQALKDWKFSLTLFVLCSLITMMYAITLIKHVYIIDDGRVSLIKTMEIDHEKILDAQGVDFRKEDKVTFTGFKRNTAEINIDRSFPVMLKADGETKELYVLGGTVLETLELANIDYKEEDIISTSLSRSVDENDVITIQRVDVEKEIIKENIPNEIVVTPSGLVEKGKIEIIDAGSPGVREKEYTHKFIDGELIETVLLREEVTIKPETEYQLKGIVASLSSFEPFSGIEIDDRGRPANAVKVLSNQRATAYSARDGASTSTGRKPMVGHVAVNPKVIPYGSRLFIETSDGYLIYGYAIAADTGGALLNGQVDVDLFLNSSEECRRFGRRTVNIYILP